MSAAGLLTTTDEDLPRRFTESANTRDRTRAGTFDVIDMAPTVPCAPDDHSDARPPRIPRHIDDDFPVEVPPDVIYLAGEARGLLTCLHTLW